MQWDDGERSVVVLNFKSSASSLEVKLLGEHDSFVISFLVYEFILNYS